MYLENKEMTGAQGSVLNGYLCETKSLGKGIIQ